MYSVTEPTGSAPVVLAEDPCLETSYITPGVPVVIKGGMQNWKALSRWTIPNLKKVMGTKGVLVRQYADRQATGPPNPEDIRKAEKAMMAREAASVTEGQFEDKPSGFSLKKWLGRK